MSDIYELIFEDIKSDVIASLLSEIDSALLEGSENRLTLENYLSNENEYSIDLPMTQPIRVFSSLNDPRVRVIKYDQKFDCEISWRGSSPDDELISSLQSFSSFVCDKYAFASFFSGLEPASDGETQLFSSID